MAAGCWKGFFSYLLALHSCCKTPSMGGKWHVLWATNHLLMILNLLIYKFKTSLNPTSGNTEFPIEINLFMQQDLAEGQ